MMMKKKKNNKVNMKGNQIKKYMKHVYYAEHKRLKLKFLIVRM